jgi:hypothetical protein
MKKMENWKIIHPSYQISDRKALYFPKDEAEKIFTLTVKQFKEENKEALVCLRGEHHGLLKSELLK